MERRIVVNTIDEQGRFSILIIFSVYELLSWNIFTSVPITILGYSFFRLLITADISLLYNETMYSVQLQVLRIRRSTDTTIHINNELIRVVSAMILLNHDDHINIFENIMDCKSYSE